MPLSHIFYSLCLDTNKFIFILVFKVFKCIIRREGLLLNTAEAWEIMRCAFSCIEYACIESKM
jgi:hypothetical protein